MLGRIAVYIEEISGWFLLEKYQKKGHEPRDGLHDR